MNTLRVVVRGSRRLGAVAVVAAGLAATGLGGCVRQGEYDGVAENNRALTGRNQELSDELNGLKSANSTLNGVVAQRDQTINELRRLLDEANSQRTAMADRLRQLEERLGGISFTALDPELDQALRDLAAQYPGVLEFDSSRGMLRFTSDLTFASGKADITTQGRQTIDALARILKTPVAQPYDVRVVGHTDSQPIAASRNLYPTNVHLSAARAISVRAELVNSGIDPQKVEIAGWGEFRPRVANSAGGNTPQNRRVEVFLVKAPGGGTTMTSSAPSVPEPSRPVRQDDVMK